MRLSSQSTARTARVSTSATTSAAGQPFMSAGIGALNLRTDELTDLGFEDSSETTLGFNLGGGAMGFWDRRGVRGDLRYLSDLSADDNSPLDAINCWQGTVGVAYRW